MSMIPPSEGVRTFPPSGLAKTELASPRTIDEACELLARAGVEGKRTVVLAGGTDWIVDRQLMAPEKATQVDQVIDLTRVEALSSIGFYVPDDGVLNRHDVCNVEPEQTAPASSDTSVGSTRRKLRGTIRPVHVLDPLITLVERYAKQAGRS